MRSLNKLKWQFVWARDGDDVDNDDNIAYNLDDGKNKNSTYEQVCCQTIKIGTGFVD